MIDALPVVAVIGRPNTGKSSLFNLLLGEQKSIVDEMEGVTRDINIGRVKTPHSMFYVYDTAGYLDEGDSFNALVQKKVREAIRSADLILFTVDGRNSHPLDDELAAFLKREGKTVYVIANKLDNKSMEDLAIEFYSLGFETVIPFSVTQKRGLAELLDKIEDFLSHLDIPEAAPEEIRIAIAGRPNVGKSQLLNTILGYERSIVSPIAGTTRDSVDDLCMIKGRKVRLIDTAGLRRKGKVQEDIEYYSNVRTVQAIERSEVVIQLLDATEPLSHQDKRITDIVQEKGRGLVLVFNKWDLVKPKDPDENRIMMKQFRDRVVKELAGFPHIPVFFISALEKYKIEPVLESALHVFDEFHYRVATADLNDWLKREIRETEGNKPVSELKIYYATQVYTAPPGFLFFINKKDYVRKDYPRFIENRLRLSFEFTGVPVKIVFKEKERRGQDD